jgi:hypothetical protein
MTTFEEICMQDIRDRVARAGLTDLVESTASTLTELNMSDLYVGPAYRPRPDDVPDYHYVEDFDDDYGDLLASHGVDFGPYPTAEYDDYVYGLNHPEYADFSDDALGEFDADGDTLETWQDADANPEG